MGKTLLLLVGPKGAGKTSIGTLLEKQGLAKFIAVEQIFLALMAEQPDLKGIELENHGFARVQDEIARQFESHNVICIETTGTALTFTNFLASLQARYSVVTVKVTTPTETCLTRIQARDATAHIPASEARIREINRIAEQVELEWDGVLQNGGDWDEVRLLDEVTARLKTYG